MIRSALIGLLLVAAPAHAGETRQATPGTPPPAATIAAADWLVGTWRGPGVGGAPALETYSAPTAGQISGHFEQLDGNGAIRFYELIQIVERGGSLVYRLKHFDADLGGWEDKAGTAAESFALVAVEPDALHFDGLSFYRKGPDRARVVVRIHAKSGPDRELAFDYTRTSR